MTESVLSRVACSKHDGLPQQNMYVCVLLEMCEHRVHCQRLRDLHLRSARPLLEGHAGELECLSYILVGINVIYSVMPERVPPGRSCCSVVYSGWLTQQALFFGALHIVPDASPLRYWHHWRVQSWQELIGRAALEIIMWPFVDSVAPSLHWL